MVEVEFKVWSFVELDWRVLVPRDLLVARKGDGDLLLLWRLEMFVRGWEMSGRKRRELHM